MKNKIPQEEKINAVTHLFGVFFTVGAIIIVGSMFSKAFNWVHYLGVGLFLGAAFIMFLFSTIYHSVTAQRSKSLFRLFDHMSIYLLIAGTYTPFLLIGVGGDLGWYIFFTVWFITSVGIAFKAIYRHRYPKLSLSIYLILGWFAIFIAKPLYQNLSPETLTFLILGGISYTLGTVFYAMKNRRYAHAIWHLFVIAGVLFHTVAIFYLL